MTGSGRKGKFFSTQIGGKSSKLECSGCISHLGAQGRGMCLARDITSLSLQPCFCSQLPPGLQSHDLSLSGKRQAECINSSETQALDGFFFRCISHLRCGTDGESAACASTLAPGAPRVSDRWDKTLEGSKHVWHHSCVWKREVKYFSTSQPTNTIQPQTMGTEELHPRDLFVTCASCFRGWKDRFSPTCFQRIETTGLECS